MHELDLSINGVRVPRFLYGTAWKEERTRELTELALQQGFRGIDTANQRRHYVEVAVGQAIQSAFDANLVRRDELFLQTKFTFLQGQDHRLPYDASDPISDQVVQSFDSSLDHLGVEKLDSYVLHGPSQRAGLGSDDWAAWSAMEKIYDSGRVRCLGISNVDFDQLRLLYQQSYVKPRFVQNRCFATTGWDREIRSFCAANEMVYQGFSLVTANTVVLTRPPVVSIAERHQRTIPQIVFRFALQSGMVVLTGTTSSDHMQEDLDTLTFSLEDDEVREIERAAL